MKININNYEAFFLDYHEGNLSPQQVEDIFLFVEEHPEHREEFESFENISLEDYSEVTFENKSELKKEITVENKDTYFIKSIENTILPAEKILLENFLKQHPQYLTDMAMFQKTKFKPDTSIEFENKGCLKRISATTDDLLIAFVEGSLSKSETVLLNQQLAVDSEMQHNLSLYKKTKLVADVSVVFENKEELKHKERKTFPIFYYVAIAASLLFLFGLYFLFNTKHTKQDFANNHTTPVIQHNQMPSAKNDTALPVINKSLNNSEKSLAARNTNFMKKYGLKNKREPVPSENKKTIRPVIENNFAKANEKNSSKNKTEAPPVENKETVKPVIENTFVKADEEKNKNTTPVTENKTQSVTTSNNPQPITAMTEEKKEAERPRGFFSFLGGVVVEKAKEITLDDKTVAMQKKSGKLKKVSRWDVAQVVTKGLGKVTGLDIEVKPTYNDNGNVTAFALGAGEVTFAKRK